MLIHKQLLRNKYFLNGYICVLFINNCTFKYHVKAGTMLGIIAVMQANCLQISTFS